MRSPRILLAALVTIAVALAGGCSDDAKKSTAKSGSSSTTTGKGATAGPATSTTTTAAPVDPAATTTRVTLPPVDDSTFGSTLTKLNSALDAAGTDTCKILTAFPTDVPSAGTVAQVKQEIALIARQLTALGNSLPAEQKANADALIATATAVTSEATSKSFDPKTVRDGAGLNAFTNRGYGQAMHDVSETCAKQK